MKPHNRFFLLSLTALLLIATAVTLESFQPARTAHDESGVATYSHGILHANIPYSGTHAGAGPLTVEILDPEDAVLGRTQREVNASDGKGSWQEDVKLTKAVGTDDLVWHRLRYRFVYSDGKAAALEGTESISEMDSVPCAAASFRPA